MWRASIFFLPEVTYNTFGMLTCSNDMRNTLIHELKRGELITRFLSVNDEKEFRDFLIFLGKPKIYNLNGKIELNGYSVFKFEQMKLSGFIDSKPEKTSSNINTWLLDLLKYARYRLDKATLEIADYNLTNWKMSIRNKNKKNTCNEIIIINRYTTKDIFTLIWLEYMECLRNNIEPVKCSVCNVYFFSSKYSTCRVCFLCNAPSRLPRDKMNAEDKEKVQIRAKLYQQYNRGKLSLDEANKKLMELGFSENEKIMPRSEKSKKGRPRTKKNRLSDN